MSCQPRKPPQMSVEAALEEERLQVVELLEGPRRASVPPAATRRDVPLTQPPVRSMLDVSPGPLPARHGSIAGIGVGVTPPSHRGSGPIVLNEPASSPLRLSSSAASSPTSLERPSSAPVDDPSNGSDAVPAKNTLVEDKPDVDIHSDYKSDTQPSIPDQRPRRVSQPQTQERPPSRAVQGKNAVAAVMGGFDLKAIPTLSRGRDSTRRISPRGLSLDSRPSHAGRSLSPKSARLLSANPINLAFRAGRLVTDKGKVIDKDSAYRHLSDEAMSRASGSLANLPRPASRQGSDADGQADERLEKDMYDSENNPIETSEEELDTSSSENDSSPHLRRGGSKRGRKRSLDPRSSAEDDATDVKSKPPQTLLAAAEEERQMVENVISESAKPPPGRNSKKPSVHPQTSYDFTESMANTPFGSEDEAELSDIKKAQKLSIQVSTIDSAIPNRAIRTIIRGNYHSIFDGADGIRRRNRQYLVATDLSDESVYALEWTIGTILRDGDTMLAVCAMHEEGNAGPPVQIGEGFKAAMDIASVVGTQTAETTQKPHGDASLTFPRALLNRLGQISDNKSESADSKGMSKADNDRIRTVETITQTCVRLLRKTLLQVRIAVEVIHCKSPKHMITEAIDGLEPTLVIVGATGTSALKGVLLGSFSNYLVSKSSVPVMVARKKLKKQTKQKKTNIRLSNNLTTPKKLALAKVD